MGCLISKPIFKLTYSSNNMTLELDNPILVDSGSATNIKGLGEWTHVKNTPKILIDLSYFIRKNKNKYLNNNVVSAFGPFGASGSGLNNNILHISHLDNNAVLRTESNSKVRNNILCKYYPDIPICIPNKPLNTCECNLCIVQLTFTDYNITTY